MLIFFHIVYVFNSIHLDVFLYTCRPSCFDLRLLWECRKNIFLVYFEYAISTDIECYFTNALNCWKTHINEEMSRCSFECALKLAFSWGIYREKHAILCVYLKDFEEGYVEYVRDKLITNEMKRRKKKEICHLL